MPIWNDLYERNYELLKENQLLYAIVMIDKNNGNLKFNCKWLSLLDRPLDVLIKESDTVYDQFKNMVRLTSFRRNKAAQGGQGNRELVKNIIVYLDAATIRLSHILKLKTILQNNPGNSSVEMIFLDGENKAGSVVADSSWGLKADAKNLSLIKQIPGIKKIVYK